MMGRFAAHLGACDPARDLRRAYTLEAGRDLFGARLVAVAFGRIGRPGRRLVYGLAKPRCPTCGGDEVVQVPAPFVALTAKKS